MVCVEHAKGEDVKKLFLTLMVLKTQLILRNTLLQYPKTLPFFTAPKMVLRSSNTRLIRPSVLTMELFIAFLEHEKLTFSLKVLSTQLVSKK